MERDREAPHLNLPHLSPAPMVAIHSWGWYTWEVPGAAASCFLPEAPGKLSPLKLSDSPRPLTDIPGAPDSRPD